MPISKSCDLRVGITMGDPSGIGPEVIAKGLKQLKGVKAKFIVIGDFWVYRKVAKTQNLQDGGFVDLNNVRHKGFAFGQTKAEYGRASIEYLDKALDLLETGELDCLITGPISKESINLAGFRYFGHTEYFSVKTNTPDPVMMLMNNFLKISLVTRHIPIKSVSFKLNQGLILRTIILTHRVLKQWFAVSRPRIAVCGLNPHASDNGLIGDEENKTIKPALKKLRKMGLNIDGPLSADIVMYKNMAKLYDAAIAMYHDQALIALKVTDSSSGVNLTLGLPFVRTSPLHGTAFELAGKNKASADSFVAAAKLAVKCALNLKKD
jgi:4-hydroxythreonine-4-phosphate dehydrogenase